MVLKVATWNINSFRLRENLIVKAISEYSPDLICLQECKSPVEKMPFEAFKKLGWEPKISLEDGIKLVHERGKLMQAAVPEEEGAMLAVMGLDINDLNLLIKKFDKKKVFVKLRMITLQVK